MEIVWNTEKDRCCICGHTFDLDNLPAKCLSCRCDVNKEELISEGDDHA